MITDNYIKMCEKAKEIQKDWKPKVGDCYYENGENLLDKKSYHYRAILDKEKSYLFFKNSTSPMFKYRRFLLPTLEQLFEMIWEIDMKNRVQMHYGINECEEENYQLQIDQIDPQDNNYEEEYISDSIKGCLLQYIYRHKYHKVWVSEKWVKAQ